MPLMHCSYCLKQVEVQSRRAGLAAHIQTAHPIEWKRMQMRCNNIFSPLVQTYDGGDAHYVQETAKATATPRPQLLRFFGTDGGGEWTSTESRGPNKEELAGLFSKLDVQASSERNYPTNADLIDLFSGAIGLSDPTPVMKPANCECDTTGKCPLKPASREPGAPVGYYRQRLDNGWCKGELVECCFYNHHRWGPRLAFKAPGNLSSEELVQLFAKHVVEAKRKYEAAKELN